MHCCYLGNQYKCNSFSCLRLSGPKGACQNDEAACPAGRRPQGMTGAHLAFVIVQVICLMGLQLALLVIQIRRAAHFNCGEPPRLSLGVAKFKQVMRRFNMLLQSLERSQIGGVRLMVGNRIDAAWLHQHSAFKGHYGACRIPEKYAIYSVHFCNCTCRVRIHINTLCILLYTSMTEKTVLTR